MSTWEPAYFYTGLHKRGRCLLLYAVRMVHLSLPTLYGVACGMMCMIMMRVLGLVLGCVRVHPCIYGG